MTTQLFRDLDLRCTRFEFSPEVVAKVFRMGLSSCEVPVHYNRRGRLDGKKIGWRDAIREVRTMLYWRVVPIPRKRPSPCNKVSESGRATLTE